MSTGCHHKTLSLSPKTAPLARGQIPARTSYATFSCMDDSYLNLTHIKFDHEGPDVSRPSRAIEPVVETPTQEPQDSVSFANTDGEIGYHSSVPRPSGPQAFSTLPRRYGDVMTVEK